MKKKFASVPFCLNDAQISWVEDTLASLSTEDRLRQLFCLITYSDDAEELRRLAEQVRPGGVMSRPVPAEQALRTVRSLQEHSRIPLLISANLEAGGSGLLSDGTLFAKPMAIAATDDAEQARRLGEICGTEGSAVGANWAFAPIVDIDYNWRNPITNTRTFGSDPERVRRMGVAYVTELQKHGMAACCKHFPGDGRDERDQHIAPSINDLSCGEWDRSYGMVYRAAITAGVQSIMIGHILQPAYSRRFRPELRDGELLPASVSYELVTDLLRGQLGFNGLIVTDSSTMAGVTAFLPREQLVPQSIAAGCDMFLFTKDLEEDFSFLANGLRKGIFTEERLAEAVTRILALKAALRLPEKRDAGWVVSFSAGARWEKTMHYQIWKSCFYDEDGTAHDIDQRGVSDSPMILGEISGAELESYEAAEKAAKEEGRYFETFGLKDCTADCVWLEPCWTRITDSTAQVVIK